MNRPERRNAINAELRDALASALDDAAGEAEVRAIVITGSGGAFCAGGDIVRFEELRDARLYRHISHKLSELMEAVERLEKPVIAAIDGAATGAALRERRDPQFVGR